MGCQTVLLFCYVHVNIDRRVTIQSAQARPQYSMNALVIIESLCVLFFFYSIQLTLMDHNDVNLQKLQKS